MSQGSGLGPVFAFEWLTRSRRWQGYAVRGLFVLALLIGFWLVWRSAMSSTYLSPRQQLAQAGDSFFSTLTIIQLALVLLVAPAATAGAICLDKARGTLAHVMVTDLTDREVVLGKLAARLVPVLNLVACALPVAALGTLLGGIDPMALTAAFLIAVGVAILGCSLALTLSVWMIRTHEVLIVVFALWTAWLVALPGWQIFNRSMTAPAWLEISNPFWLTLAPSGRPGRISMIEPVGFFLVCLILSVGLAGLAVARLRPVYLHQANRVPKAVRTNRVGGWLRRSGLRMPSPSLDFNPVLWREWHRNRPSRVVRVIWGIYIGLTSLISLKIIWDRLAGPPVGMGGDVGGLYNGFQASFGLLLLGASAGTVLSEERIRGSLDVLLATPMSTHSIVWGKWWGAFRRAPWLAFWPAMIAFTTVPSSLPAVGVIFAILVPVMIILQAAALTGLGLALATWFARTGRAVSLTIAAVVVSVVGWPILGSTMFSRASGMDLQNTVAMGSPFWNAGFTTHLIEQLARSPNLNAFEEQGSLVGLLAWMIVYASAAVGLYLAALLTFDRCLGRTSEHSGAPIVPVHPARVVGQAKHRKITWVEDLEFWDDDRKEKVKV